MTVFILLYLQLYQTLSPTAAAAAMKIITQLVILTLSLLLVNADQYCDNFIKQYNTFRSKCSLQSLTITSCCDLRIVSSVSGVYKLNKGTFNSADVYCDMNTTTGGWIVIQRNKKDSLVNFNKNLTKDLESSIQNFGMGWSQCIA